jgi:GT2 family glycosyltransferase
MIAVSVVIPTHSRLDILRETVARALQQNFAEGAFEVVVVDDHSADGSYEWLCEQARSEARLRPVQSPRRGRAAARNAGIEVAGGELICFLDDDMWVGPGFLQAHWRAYQENRPAPVVCVGRMRPWPGNAPTVANLAYDRRLAHIDDCMAQYGDDLPCRYLCTGNVSLPRSLLQSGITFDEGFEGYSFEDTDLGYRLAEQGVRFRYLPEARAEHRTETTVAALLRKREEAGRSAVRLLRHHPGAAAHLEVPYAVAGVAGTARHDCVGKGLAKTALFSRPCGWALEALLRVACVMGAKRPALRLLDWAGYTRYGRAYRQAAAESAVPAGKRQV